MQKQLGQLLLNKLLIICEIQQDSYTSLLDLIKNIAIVQWIEPMQLWF
jgi:hypothetical protein